MLKISRNNLDAFYKAIADKMPLYLPLVKGGEVNFGYYTDGAKVDIDTLKTVKSPKDVFFPHYRRRSRRVETLRGIWRTRMRLQGVYRT